MIGIGIGINHQTIPGAPSPSFLISELALNLITETGDFLVAETTN
jgi:hypothetical protein